MDPLMAMINAFLAEEVFLIPLKDCWNAMNGADHPTPGHFIQTGDGWGPPLRMGSL